MSSNQLHKGISVIVISIVTETVKKGYKLLPERRIYTRNEEYYQK